MEIILLHDNHVDKYSTGRRQNPVHIRELQALRLSSDSLLSSDVFVLARIQEQVPVGVSYGTAQNDIPKITTTKTSHAPLMEMTMTSTQHTHSFYSD